MKNILNTCFDKSPAVGALSSGSDSGIVSTTSLKSSSPVQPIHWPLQSITTGATAVTNPPALYEIKNTN